MGLWQRPSLLYYRSRREPTLGTVWLGTVWLGTVWEDTEEWRLVFLEDTEEWRLKFLEVA
jgi:hypothetical protein